MIISILTAAAKAAGVPPLVLIALCSVESRLNPNAVNLVDGGSASYGLCQIKAATAQDMGYRGEDLMLIKSPKLNAKYSAKYLAWQIKRYNGDLAKGIMAYNMGRAPAKGDTIYLTKVLKELLKLAGKQ